MGPVWGLVYLFNLLFLSVASEVSLLGSTGLFLEGSLYLLLALGKPWTPVEFSMTLWPQSSSAPQYLSVLSTPPLCVCVCV